MAFDPRTMSENGQQWFSGEYSRIRWWAKEGQYLIVRPTADENVCENAGFSNDILWTVVAHLDHHIGNGIFAEWYVGRADLGINLTATKVEIALNRYYERLAETEVEGRIVREAIGRENMRGMIEQFSSVSPKFSCLCDLGKAPLPFAIEEKTNDIAVACENVNPMKRSVFAKR